MKKAIGFTILVLVFCLLQLPSALSSEWVECNTSTLGRAEEVGGIQYTCVRENGAFNWVGYSSQPASSNLLVIVFFVVLAAVVGLLMLLNKKKVRKFLKGIFSL
jgi:hypothetical protein